MISPKFDAFSNQYDSIKFIKVDVDQGEDICQEVGISCMPTFLFYKGGNQQGRLEGANEAKLKENLEKIF